MEDVPKGSARWAPWVAGSVIAALAIAAIFAYVSSPEKVDPPASASSKPEVERGSACASLAAASEALDEGDDERVVDSIKSARSEAIRSLDEGGVIFGKPEELALKLGSDPLDTPFQKGVRKQIAERLTAASEACEELTS